VHSRLGTEIWVGDGNAIAYPLQFAFARQHSLWSVAPVGECTREYSQTWNDTEPAVFGLALLVHVLAVHEQASNALIGCASSEVSSSFLDKSVPIPH
jgi:hypothetical protein